MTMELAQQYKPVEVNQRALIDKVLSRYSGEFTLFRELLQNSDDAGCSKAEIHFETAAHLHQGDAEVANMVNSVNVKQWTFRNYGKPFTEDDWKRLPRIAEGNPDPEKVGAFGVGFYSVFSVTDSPHVLSGGSEMEFSWKDDNRQLFYRFGDLGPEASLDKWTEFKLPLREASPMPSLLDLMRFLASSITFMVNLEDVGVFLDQDILGNIHKSGGDVKPINIPVELNWRNPGKGFMVVKEVLLQSIRIEATIKRPVHNTASNQAQSASEQSVHHSQVDLSVLIAEVEIAVEEKLSAELFHCVKKKPPRRLKYSLVYTTKDDYDRSDTEEQTSAVGESSVFRGLLADLDGATHTRIFIGHATGQTTGIGGHMASRFIPTVERESIDLVDKNVSIWNEELLYVGGFLSRVVYEWELSEIQATWENAAAGTSDLRPPPELQDQLNQRFLHVLKFFTFHHSTPSSKVSNLMASAFFACTESPFRVLSSVGVLRAANVRKYDPVFTKFLKSLPMLSEAVTRDCACFMKALPDDNKITSISPSHVREGLHSRSLDKEELIHFLRWWLSQEKDSPALRRDDLLGAATLRNADGSELSLSSIGHFIDPELLGRHIPRDGPLPPSLFPIHIGAEFKSAKLRKFGWKEFTLIPWLRYISQPDVLLANERYDFTRSEDWARRVLGTVNRVWRSVSAEMRPELKSVFEHLDCIPTSHGLQRPSNSYLPVGDPDLLGSLTLPIVSFLAKSGCKGRLPGLLAFIGVQSGIPVHSLLDTMLRTGRGSTAELVSYIVSWRNAFSVVELKSSKMFLKESAQENAVERLRHRADELYPPVEIFRKLQLPVIDWCGGSEWNDASPETRFESPSTSGQGRGALLFDGGWSTRDRVQVLVRHLRSHYSNYKPDNFRDLAFIPAESNDCICVRKLGDVYSDTRWKELGFYVVRNHCWRTSWARLGVGPHPPTQELLDRLQNTPPPNEDAARRWFNILSERITSFSPQEISRLSKVLLVPNAQKWLPPAECYLGESFKHGFYKELFVFVDFGDKANGFLRACGSKSEPSAEDIANVLVENPERFYKLAGGHGGFSTELRRLAFQRAHIHNHTLKKMGSKPTLLGIRCKKTEDQSGREYEHALRTPEEIVIVDDATDYRLFSDVIFVAPQDELLEDFYASLGCRRLTRLIKERYDPFHEIPDAMTCSDVQKLVLERLPSFIRKYTESKAKGLLPSSPDNFKVNACTRLRMHKTLVVGGETFLRSKDAWVLAKHGEGCIELWISNTAERDMYELATSLCQLLLDATKMNDCLLLGMILSEELSVLERRGFIVDRAAMVQGQVNGLDGQASRTSSKVGSLLNGSMERSARETPPDYSGCPHTLKDLDSSTGGPEFFSSSSSLHCADVSIHERTPILGSGSPSTNESKYHVIPHTSRTPQEVFSRAAIRNIVEQAKVYSQALAESPNYTMQPCRVSELLKHGFCRDHEDAQTLRYISAARGFQVLAASDSRAIDEMFGEPIADPITRFVQVITPLAEIYGLPSKHLHVFCDSSGGCIAFNHGGKIYLNVRFFEVWDYEEVKHGNTQRAQFSWFLILAHEIAHNLILEHNSYHEFCFWAICEEHFVAFSSRPFHSTEPSSLPERLPSTNVWLHHTQRLGFALIVACIAFLVGRSLS